MMISRLRFNQEGRVIEHVDFCDPAEGIWQHLPVIGAVISWLRRRFES
ncbi:MAG: hypothetical protein ACHQIL_04140 [Steroidobacterales bacterium]